LLVVKQVFCTNVLICLPQNIYLPPNMPSATEGLSTAHEDYADLMDVYKLELMTNGPLVTCFSVTEDFLHYASGVCEVAQPAPPSHDGLVSCRHLYNGT
jgi:hypothetical protein